MEHLGDELHSWGLVGILFFKMHHESKGAVFEGCICGTDDDSVPGKRSVDELKA